MDGTTTTPMETLSIPGTLTPAMLELAAAPVEISWSPEIGENVQHCRNFMRKCLEQQRPVYGASTGFGPQVIFAGRSTASDQCDNVLQHLTTGQGPHLAPALARATMLARVWSLSAGRSGVSMSVIDALAKLLASDYAPAMPSLGSVGASGDLVPLAHAAQGLRGRGLAFCGGELLEAGEALHRAGLTPLDLDGRDALALVNGTSVSVAIASAAFTQILRSHATAQMLTVALIDLLGCTHAPFESSLLQAYGHRGAVSVAARMRRLLEGSMSSGARPLQEPYSIRCTPQLLGAAWEALDHAGGVLTDDLNGVSDNPLFFPDEDLVAHGGNFFGQPCAFAADILALAATQMGNLAERQLDLLVDPNRNGGLAPMLSVDPGRQHGVQGVQIAATAIVAAMRRITVPASVQSIPTNLHNQDVVPLANHAAQNALELAGHLRLLHGSLAVALRQAAHVTARKPGAPAVKRLIEALSEVVEPVDPDRALDEDVRRAAEIVDRLETELL